MATYNGAAFLMDQLESLKRQSVAPRWVIISDDGSSDATVQIVQAFFKRWADCNLVLVQGPRQGYSANFFHALSYVPDDTTAIALSDQDDVWFDDKLERGLARLSQEADDQSVVYGAASILCDPKLAPIGPSRITTVPPSLRHALVQNFAGGNTMIFNPVATRLVTALAKNIRGVEVHDWWLYQLVTAAGGKAVYDSNPCLYYRQHSQNLIGANKGVRASANRFCAMLRGTYKRWNTQNLNALLSVEDRLTPAAVSLIKSSLALRERRWIGRLTGLRDLGLYRQGLKGTFGLWLSVLLNRF